MRHVSDTTSPNGGFTLVEILISMLLVSFIFLGISTMVGVSAKANRNAEMNANHLELENLLRMTLGKAASCTVNLRGITLDLTGKSSQVVVLAMTNPSASDPFGTKGSPLVQNGRYGKLTVEDLLLTPYTQTGVNSWIVRLLIRSRKTGVHLGGSQTQSEISAHVIVDASGTIVQCLGSSDSDLASLDDDNIVNEKICLLASDGVLIYDAATKTCIKNTNCIAGSLDEAACPPDQPITSCEASGVVDLNPIKITRNFRKGPPRDSGPPLFDCVVDRKSNSATCEYAVDTDISAARCVACCRIKSGI